MARRTTRAPRADAPHQSNIALVIGLVFAILLSLTLGVLFYLAQDKITQAEANQKKAQEESKAMQGQRDLMADFYAAKLREWLGDDGLREEDFNNIRTMAERARAGAPAWYDSAQKKMEGDPAAQDPSLKNGVIGPFNATTGKNATNMSAHVRKLAEEVAKTVRDLKARDAEMAKLKDEYDKYRQDWSAKIYEEKATAAATRANTDLDAKLKEKDAAIAELQTKIRDINNEMQKQLLEFKAAYDARVKQLAERYEETERLRAEERRLEKEKQRIDRQVALDKPRGRVLRVEPSGDRVYIDIGSDQRLPAQLTFSLYGRDPSGKVVPNVKAEIEVAQVTGRSTALARVKRVARPDAVSRGLDPATPEYWFSDARDFWQARNAIIPGDLIYNPVWDPNRRIRVALAGVFDLDGDGTDDLPTFLRLLQEQGADVDMYLDPVNDYRPRGRLEYQTEYLVIGGVPTLSQREAAEQKKELEKNPSVAVAGPLLESVTKLQQEALSKGVEIVSLPRFLSLMGFHTTRAMAPRPGAALGNGAAPRLGAPAAPPPAKDEPKPDGMR